MWKKITSLKPWQQYLLGMAWIALWAALLLVNLSWLPEPVRFASWPKNLQALSVFVFLLFVLLDFALSVWFLSTHNEPTPPTRSETNPGGESTPPEN